MVACKAFPQYPKWQGKACLCWLGCTCRHNGGKGPTQTPNIRTPNIRAMGLNCVRLTWSLFMFTDSSLGAMTVRKFSRKLNLWDVEVGVVTNNLDLLDFPVIEVYKRVVSSLGASGVMVILDNHISKPGWYCSNTNVNGFSGDRDFDPDTWIKRLISVDSMFNGIDNVVGMSLRKEL